MLESLFVQPTMFVRYFWAETCLLALFYMYVWDTLKVHLKVSEGVYWKRYSLSGVPAIKWLFAALVLYSTWVHIGVVIDNL